MKRNITGEEIIINDEKFLLPPLPLVKLAKIGKLMQGGNTFEDEEYVVAIIDAIFWSLQRNYPEVERQMIEDNLDITNFQTILDAFMSVNKLIQKGEELGEA